MIESQVGVGMYVVPHLFFVDFGLDLGPFCASVTAPCEGLRRSPCLDPKCEPRVRLVKRSFVSSALQCCRARIGARRESVVKHTVPDIFLPDPSRVRFFCAFLLLGALGSG